MPEGNKRIYTSSPSHSRVKSRNVLALVNEVQDHCWAPVRASVLVVAFLAFFDEVVLCRITF